MSDRRLLHLLGRATRTAINHVNARTIAALGVSVTQLGTLSHLAKHPGSQMTDIARIFDLNKSAASGVIARLERDGFVLREPHPRDRRGALLFLTQRGEEARLAARPVFRRAISEMTEGFTERELDVVIRFLNAIVARFAAEEEA